MREGVTAPNPSKEERCVPDRWAVPLEGESVDIEEAKRLFAEGPIRIREVEVAHGRRDGALQADELELKSDFIEVLATAERLLEYADGALFLTDNGRRPLRVLSGGTVRECGETGVYDRQSAVARLTAAARARAVFSAVVTTADGQSSTMEQAPERPVEAEALALPLSDDAVRAVLGYLRADPDHPALYNVQERIERDVIEAQKRWEASGQAGERPEFPWTGGEKRKLRQNSQPFRHGDPEAWAGLTCETAMPPTEARALVS